MATLVDLDLRLLPDAGLIPDVCLSLDGGGDVAATVDTSLPVDIRPEDIGAHDRPPVRAVSARPASVASAIVLHASLALLVVVVWRAAPISAPSDSIEVTVVSEADASPGQAEAAAASTGDSRPTDTSPSPPAAPSRRYNAAT